MRFSADAAQAQWEARSSPYVGMIHDFRGHPEEHLLLHHPRPPSTRRSRREVHCAWDSNLPMLHGRDAPRGDGANVRLVHGSNASCDTHYMGAGRMATP